MKRITIYYLVILVLNNLSFIGCRQAQEPDLPQIFEKFKYTSDQAILLQPNYFNFTNKSSVKLGIDKFGVKSVFAPPYFINPFSIGITLFNKEIDIDSYVWYPSESVFIGKNSNGISAKARVVPLANQRGGLYEVVLENISEIKLQVPVKWSFKGRPGFSKNWSFSPPIDFTDNSMNEVVTAPIESGYLFTLYKSEVSIIGYGADYQNNGANALESTIELNPGKSARIGIVFILGENNGQTKKIASEVSNDIPANILFTRKHWEKELTTVMNNAARFEGVCDQFQDFYNTGLITMLSSKWEVPEFIFSPWLATSGVDGGAMVSYLWDMSYTSKFITLLAPAMSRKHLMAFSKADMSSCYAVNPATGGGVGPLYSYNYYNLARLAYDYVCMTGDFSILDEPVGNSTYLEYLYNFCLSPEDLNKPAVLIDYGDNHNLLELKRTEAYMHFTPSPNAERVLIYDMLTELYQYKGEKTPHDLMKRKGELTETFRKRLWNEELGWPQSIDLKGNHTTCYSIQCFDVLRTGIYTKEMEERLVKHLNEQEFLSKWGVHSISKLDPGYDPEDVDWGGPGSYAGDGPELMTDLFNAGFFEKGIDLLNRILWWGELPFIPQDMRADIKGYDERYRSNIISGLSVSMHSVFGLFRLKVSINEIKIHPIEHDFMKGIALKGLKLRGKVIDVEISADGKNYTVTVNGEQKKIASDKAFLIKLKQA